MIYWLVMLIALAMLIAAVVFGIRALYVLYKSNAIVFWCVLATGTTLMLALLVDTGPAKGHTRYEFMGTKYVCYNDKLTGKRGPNGVPNERLCIDKQGISLARQSDFW